MDENKKRIAEKLKRDGEIIKKVKAEFGHEYSTLQDPIKVDVTKTAKPIPAPIDKSSYERVIELYERLSGITSELEYLYDKRHRLTKEFEEMAFSLTMPQAPKIATLERERQNLQHKEIDISREILDEMNKVKESLTSVP